MLAKIATVITLALTIEQATSIHVTHIKLDDEHLIKVGRDSYGLCGLDLDSRNLSSIVVNNETVRRSNFDCTETLGGLSDVEEDERELVDNMMQQLHLASSPINRRESQKYAITLYSSKNNLIDSAKGVKSTRHKLGQYRILLHDREYSVVSDGEPLPFGWYMFFVFGDRVAYVRKMDYHLRLVRLECLMEEQRNFVKGFAAKLVEAKLLD